MTTLMTIDTLRSTTTDGTLPTHAWPGGYPMHYMTGEGWILCPKCANEPRTSDVAIAGDVYWEGPTLTCEDCGADIESAYGDPEADKETP